MGVIKNEKPMTPRPPGKPAGIGGSKPIIIIIKHESN